MRFAVVLLLALPGFARSAGDAKQAQMHYLKGVLLERRGLAVEALAEYEAALKEDPESAYIGREAAELALELGQSEKALALALEVARQQPQDAQARLLLGRVQWARGELAEAQASFERALKLDPKSSDSTFSLSALLSAHSPAKARALLTRFLREQPSHASEAHFHLAKIDLQQGAIAAAIGHLRQCIALDPDGESLPARYALAQAFEVERATKAALGEYLEIAKLEPENVALLDHIGEMYAMSDDWETAGDWFERARRLAPGDPSASHWLALRAEKRGEFAKAAVLLSASSALDEDSSLALRLSYYLSQAGETKRAVGVLEEARKRFPKNDQVAYFLALGYQDVKRDAEAVKLLEEIVELKPEFRDARYQLGVALERKGDWEAAEKQFRALLAARPDDASALNYLGYTLAERGLKLGEAEALIAHAVALEPTNGAYQDSLGWVHFKLGNHVQAVAELRGALALLPADETVWEHYADAALAAGREDDAWLAYKRAQSLTNGKSAAARKAQKLQKKFSAERLGGLFLKHLAVVQGGLRRMSGLAALTVKAGGKTQTFDALVKFVQPASFSIEVLGGPFFTPMITLVATENGATAGPFSLDGVPEGAAEEAARDAVRVMRDYLSGSVAALAPARFRSRWFARNRVRAGAAELELDSDDNVIAAYIPDKGLVTRLEISEFAREHGRLAARRLTARGRGFELGLVFNDAKLDVSPAPTP